MLNQRENERLTQVGRGTEMGELMRRYWHPVAATAELEDRPTKALRILGEDLVLYRDKSGTYGLIERFCPHRRVDLSYGIPEEHGLRCMYHGWMMDETGQCIEQPFEETVHPDGRFKEKVKIDGYPVQEMGGLLFAYMGPQPTPFLPVWDPFQWDDAVHDVGITTLDCNWLQCMENSLDPVHVEWLHRFYTNYQQAFSRDLLATMPPRIPHKEIGFDVFDHGIIKRRVLEGYTKESDDWKTGHPILFPQILYVGGFQSKTLQYRVPIDDEHTLHFIYYSWRVAPGQPVPKQDRIPYKYVPHRDASGNYNTKFTVDQDKMAWETQGPIAKRYLERLGKSDIGVIFYRKLLTEQMQIVADGGEPMNVFRTQEAAQNIHIPTEHMALGRDQVPRIKFIPLEAGVSGAEADAEYAVESWYVNEKANATS